MAKFVVVWIAFLQEYNSRTEVELMANVVVVGCVADIYISLSKSLTVGIGIGAGVELMANVVVSYFSKSLTEGLGAKLMAHFVVVVVQITLLQQSKF